MALLPILSDGVSEPCFLRMNKIEEKELHELADLVHEAMIKMNGACNHSGGLADCLIMARWALTPGYGGGPWDEPWDEEEE